MASRLAVLASLGIASSAFAGDDPPPLAKPLAKALKSQGYTEPALVLSAGDVRVILATKGKTKKLLLGRDKGQLVDSTVPIEGEVVVVRGSSVPPYIAEFVQIDVRQASQTRSATTILLVRPNGQIACKLAGNDSTNSGPSCGSSGYRSVEIQPALRSDDGPPAFELHVIEASTFSSPDGKGGCQTPPSPMRTPTMVTTVTLPAKGMCTLSKPRAESRR